MNFDPRTIARETVLNLKAYSSARDEFDGDATVFLDANENSYGSPLGDDFSRYPDPSQGELRSKLAGINGVPVENLFVGNGSDEIIDLLIRVFCEPIHDEIIICPPAYGMYSVCAATSGVSIREAGLDTDFFPDREMIAKVTRPTSKLLFLCSPNNPTGGLIENSVIEAIAKEFPGVVVVDEAYVEFSGTEGFLPLLRTNPNVVILRTLSKAWGLAGLRIGLGFGSKETLSLLRKIKPPYNISEVAQHYALRALEEEATYRNHLRLLISERKRLTSALGNIPFVERVFQSDANFLLIRFADSERVFRTLKQRGVIVRDRSNQSGCESCLRITVGTERQNTVLLELLKEMV